MTKKTKLVLHIDLNSTVIVVDPASKVNTTESINLYLSGVLFGRIGPEGEWVPFCDRPLVSRPKDSGIVSYYKYTEVQSKKSSKENDFKSKLASTFTNENTHGAELRPVYQKMLRELEWNHPSSEMERLAPLYREENGVRYHFLLPSFFHLLETLISQGREFSIIFRTFGQDYPDTQKALEVYCDGLHPLFPREPSHPKSSHYKRYLPSPHHGSIHYLDKERIKLRLDGDKEIIGDEEIYRWCSTIDGASGIVESYNHWKENNYLSSSGKPFLFDLNDKETHHIFFDDNLRDPDHFLQGLDDGESICNLRVKNVGSSQFSRVKAKDYHLFRDMYWVKAELLHSILEKDYFVDKVRTCEENREHFLQNSHTNQNKKK